jgi:hypothetical protein
MRRRHSCSNISNISNNKNEKKNIFELYKTEFSRMIRPIDSSIDNPIDIDINKEHTPSSSSDRTRDEERWDSQNTAYFRKIIAECRKKSFQHGKQGRKVKKIYQLSSIPLISLPIIVSVLSKQLSEYELLSSIFFIVIGIGNVISAFLNLGQKYQINLEYECRYDELACDVESELIKGKEYRLQFDVYLTRVRLKLNNLNKNAPLI